jgi:hypothetical protein
MSSTMYMKVGFIQRDDVDVDVDEISGHSKEQAQAKARLRCNAVDLSLQQARIQDPPQREWTRVKHIGAKRLFSQSRPLISFALPHTLICKTRAILPLVFAVPVLPVLLL